MKLLFVDIDDTLLNSKRELDETNKQAIAKTLKKGNKVIITTGRPLPGMVNLLKQLDLEKEGCYAITYNGGQIYDCYKKEVLYRSPVNYEYAKELYYKAKEKDLHVQTYSENDELMFEKYDENSQFYVGRLNIPYTICDLSKDLPLSPTKMMLVDVHSHQKLVDFMQENQEWAEGKFNMFFSNPAFLECVEPNTDKGNALKWLCEYLNVDLSDSIAVGDSGNDISMIKMAGVGCAMANATQETKEAADYITVNDCDHGGVAEVIEKFM